MSGTGAWGSGQWGGGAWGGFAPSTTLTLLAAVAIAENVIQLQFSDMVYFSGLLDTPDGANPDRYSVAIVSGTSGLDGNAVRPVTVVSATQSVSASEGGNLPAGAILGTYVELTLDRPMTPYPAQYVITANGLFSADFSESLDTSAAAQTLYGVYAQIQQPKMDLPNPTRDFANPQSLQGNQNLPNASNLISLGLFPAGDDGDFAIDQGVQSYKKRCIRRIITLPNGFVHLPGYGVGLLSHGKKLATAQVQQRITSETQKQIALEPETDKVLAQLSSSNNGLVKFVLTLQPKGMRPFRYVTDIPVET